MPEYRVTDHTTTERQTWNDYVSGHEHGTIFHSTLMFDVFSQTPDFQPFALFAVDSHDRVQAMLQGFVQTVKPGLLSSLATRAVLLKSPLYADLSSLMAILKAARDYAEAKVVYTEIRHHWTDAASKPIYTECGFAMHRHLNYLVDCSDKEKAWQAISESKRRQIKRALAAGAEIVDNPTAEQFAEFYRILHKLYAEKVRMPLPSIKFFRSLYDMSLSHPEMIKYLLVSYRGTIIGGICCPISGEKAVHELYVAGLDAEYREVYPSSVATWAAIEYACRKGISSFDFMGAGKPDEDYGVREFKSRFGGILVESGRYQCIHSPLKMLIAETGFRLLRKLKGRI